MNRKSWVWSYAERKLDKAYCNLCNENNNEFACPGGTTGSLGRHLKNVHKIIPPTTIIEASFEPTSIPETNNVETGASTSLTPSRSRKRRHNTEDKRSCDPRKTENIHQALARMLAINQLPLSFCSSEGFKQFMAVVEPSYKICTEESIKRRLFGLRDALRVKITNKLKDSAAIACTSDCWSSRAQDSYLTITAHIINEDWEPMSFTLTTLGIEERHTAVNIADCMDTVFDNWGIGEKIIAVVTDNAANMVNAVKHLKEIPEFYENLTCAAHSIQLAIGKGLSCNDSIQPVLQKTSKVIAHFKHSNVAMLALEQKQIQLGMTKQNLLQSCITRWNSTYFMLERLLKNRIPVISVLADRTISSLTTAQKLTLSEDEWTLIEALIVLLKPLEVLTTILCSDKNSPISMVRPLLMQVIKNHFQCSDDDTEFSAQFKTTITKYLTAKFQLAENCEPNLISARHVASFLDPRYKDLEHENQECRQNIRDYIKEKIRTTNTSEADDEESQDMTTMALQYIYNQNFQKKDPLTQFEGYLSEVQLRFELDPLEWWKARAQKYPSLNLLAKKFLSIPATSASSERSFSTAGNIITAKRSCLLPENVDMLVFLYQNRSQMSDL